MRMTDLIEKKRTGKALTETEIRALITGFTSGEIPDYQMAAYLMAVCFRGMTDEEAVTFTKAMRDSGDVLDLSGIKGTKIDKHSSGGVGDKTTLILAPLVASLGVPVAKMSGRGLGNTGGTIDKLESIPGFRTTLSDEAFLSQVNETGIAVAGQTKNLVPADKKIYALRDTTATVAEKSLIASSIMSKKLASGADAIVLDVKVGSGAFMKTEAEAAALAELMVKIGNGSGKKTVALLSDMNEPLGHAVGNSLEVKEVIAALQGNGPKDLMEVTFALGAEMLTLSELKLSREEAKQEMLRVIEDGSALQKLKDWIKAQGGDESVVEDPDRFPKATIVKEIPTPKSGSIAAIEAEKIGHAVMRLGGGRAKKEDVIDPAVGVYLHQKTGDIVAKGDVLLTLYANDEEKAKEAEEELLSAYRFSGSLIEKGPMLLRRIE